jgi:F-type H+-transporting ATPase subunit gamma
MPTLKEYNVKLAGLRNTCKVMRTMRMISANKLRRAQEAQRRAEEFEAGVEAVRLRLLAPGGGCADHPLLRTRRPVRRSLAVVITSDRGLCGGFNSNLNKKVLQWVGEERAAGRRVDLRFIGRRGFLFFRQRDEDGFLYADVGQKPAFAPARRVAVHLCEAFIEGAYDEVHLAYSRFRTVLAQTPAIERLLPLDGSLGAGEEARADAGAEADTLVEPAAPDLLSRLPNQTVSRRLYAALLHSAAGEHGARMTAMENANANAESLAETYTLLRNRARQAAITRELIEIVAGAEALN